MVMRASLTLDFTATSRGSYMVERFDYAPISGISSPISIALLAGVSSRASSI
jgi:hypothetical protein